MRLAITVFLFFCLSVSAPAGAQSTKPPQLGDCVWAQIPASLREEFLKAYGQDSRLGMGVLQKHDTAIEPLVDGCVGRTDVPKRWTRGAVGAQAIQNGAVNELAAYGITADMLDASWRAAPAAALDCVAANAAKAFGIMDRKCPAPGADLALLQPLKISLPANRAAAAHALYYFNARAQEEWAEALIAKIPEKR